MDAATRSVLRLSLFFLWGILVESSSSTRVLQFSPEDTGWTSQSQLEPSSFVESEELTFCYRARIHRFLPSIHWINAFEYFREQDETNNEARSRGSFRVLKVVLRNSFVASSSIRVDLMRWYHHCFSFHYPTGKFVMALDGKVIDRGAHDRKLGSFRPGGFFVLASSKRHLCSDTTSDEDCRGEFSGEIADLNVWSRVLGEEEILQITRCHRDMGEGGDMLNWDEAEWNHRNVLERDVSLASICHEKDDGLMVFPELRPFDESYSFCRSLGAEMAAPKTKDEHARLLNVTAPFSEKCVRFFLGWTDRHSEGTYVDENAFVTQGGRLDRLPEEMEGFWSTGEPNGGRLENCVELRTNGR